MFRRAVFALGCFLSLMSAGPYLHALGTSEALMLLPNERPVLLKHFYPAKGPLDRYTSRPGAWYFLIFLPAGMGSSFELGLWPKPRMSDLRLTALDRVPDDAPSVAFPLSTEEERGQHGKSVVLTYFSLPASSKAEGVYVLIEWWSTAGTRPAPIWIFSGGAPQGAKPGADLTGSAWWEPREANTADRNTAPVPSSPLTSYNRSRGRSPEVPIYK